jgi:hypothetical protein
MTLTNDRPHPGPLPQEREKKPRGLSPKMNVDLSHLDLKLQLEVYEELVEMQKQEALFMELEQIEAAKENQNRRVTSIDGVGQQVLAISPTAFIYYKAIEGLDFSNPRDIRWLTNRYPEMKVNCGGCKLAQVGYEGARSRKPEARKDKIVAAPRDGAKRSRKIYPSERSNK